MTGRNINTALAPYKLRACAQGVMTALLTLSYGLVIAEPTKKIGTREQLSLILETIAL